MTIATLLSTADVPMSRQRLLNAYLTEAKYALLRFLRSPAFAIPTLLFPVLFYLLIGFLFGAFRSTNPNLPTYMFCGFATMAAITPGMFGFGIGLALEREQGLFLLKRALPLPPLASLAASVAMSVISSAIAVTLLAITALAFGTVQLPLWRVLAVIPIVALGAIPFSALGLLIGSIVSGRAAPAIVNIVYLVLLYFSGLFIPLPKAISAIVFGSPAFYLHQLALGGAGAANSMVGGAWVHVAVLAAVAVACITVARRRLARVG